MVRRGFTIVELLIVIAIMGILLVLAVVNVRSTQITARDTERKGDVEAIGLALENFYRNDFRNTDTGTSSGRYPSTGLVPIPSSVLPDLDPKSYIAPGETTNSLVAATNADQTPTGVTPQPTLGQYVYQPLSHNGTNWIVCSSGDCRKFNIYYRLEADNTVYKAMSKNQ